MNPARRLAVRITLALPILGLAISLIIVGAISGPQAALNVLYGTVMWGLIPATLLAYLTTAAVIPYRVTKPEGRLSARAGFLAGLVLFAGYCVAYAPRLRDVDFAAGPLPSFNVFGALGGLLLGFALLELIKRLLPSRGVGILTLLMASASTIALFSYLFRTDIRGVTLYFTLGSLFGGLLYIVLFPGFVQGIHSA